MTTATAGPASGDVATFTQPDGTCFNGQLRGDEWFSWHETTAGYVIGKDGDGKWKYGRPRTNRTDFELLPEGEVGKASPAALGLSRHALPAPALIRERLRSLRAQSLLPRQQTPAAGAAADTAGALGSASTSAGLAPAAIANSTSLRCVVILAGFSDHWDNGNNTVLSARGKTRAEYDTLLNTVGYNVDGAVGSARDYYREVSYGKTDIAFTVSNWVKLPQTEAYYGDNTNEVKGAALYKTLAADALAAASTAGFDFSQSDSDGDGWGDLLVIIHSGFSESLGGNAATCIWPRQGSLVTMTTLGTKKFSAFSVVSAMRGLQSTTPEKIMHIGTIVHEMGHLFGLSDLYDVGGNTKGIGTWGLMGLGSWGQSGGASTDQRPTHMEAYSKMLMGYLDPQVVTCGDALSLGALATSPAAHLLRGSASADEYFLIENRSKTGFDTDLPPGLLITHVDTKAVTCANDSSVFSHPALRVEEANGGNALATAGAATANQVWTSTNGLAGGFRDATGNTVTNAMAYQAGQQYTRADSADRYTGLTADAFSAAGTTMTYRLRSRVPAVQAVSPTTGSYTVSWLPAAGATLYELQQGAAATLTSFSDDAESLASMRDNWQIIGAVGRSTLGNATSGGSACYEFSGKLPGLDGINDSNDDYFMPEWRGLILRAPFTLTATTSLGFKYLSNVWSGYGTLRFQLTKDNGATWTTLGTYADHYTSWTTVTVS